MGPVPGAGRGSAMVSPAFGSSWGSEDAAATDSPVSSQYKIANVIPAPSAVRLRIISPLATKSVLSRYSLFL